MKLLKLHITNIASIESATIDFENGPLADESCFLICGPTGAGKSTILDAISLALYNRTPRTHSANNESYNERTENFGKDIKINDSRVLMRRGTDLARVELWFTDLNDRKLMACWQVERAKRKSKGNDIRSIKEEEWSLADEKGNIIVSKKAEMKAVIPECIGLTFDQFCRTTMLAQGEFTKFLRSDESEKSVILEKLTGTEIYTEISKEIHRCKAEKENDVKIIKGQIGDIKPLSEDEINTLNENIRSAQRIFDESKEEENSLTIRLNLVKDYRQTTQERETATGEYESFLKQLSSDEYIQTMSRMNEWYSTSDARTWFVERKAWMEQKSTLQSRESSLLLTYTRLRGGLLYEETAIEEMKKECEEKKTFIDSRQQQKELYASVPFIKQMVGLINNDNIALQKTIEEKENYRQELVRLTTILDEKQLKLKAALELEQEALSQYDKAKEKAEAYNLVELTRMNSENNNRLTALQYLEGLFVKVDEIQDKTKQDEKSVCEVQKQLEDLLKEKESYSLTVEQAQKEYDDFKQRYEQLKKNLDDSRLLETIRTTLHEGDSCPLCGNIIENLFTPEDLENRLLPMTEVLMSKKKEWEDKLNVENRLKGNIRASETTLAGLNSNLVQTRETLAKAKMSLEAHSLFGECADKEKVQKEIADCKQTHIDIFEKLQVATALQEKLGDAQKNRETAVQNTAKIRDEQNCSEKEVSDCKSSMKAKEEAIGSLTKTKNTNLDKLGELVDLQQYKEKGDSYINCISAEADTYNQAVQRVDELGKTLLQAETMLQQCRQHSAAVEQHFPLWTEMSATNACVPELLKEWDKLDRDVMNVVQAYTQTENNICKYDTMLKQYATQPGAVSESRIAELVEYTSEQMETVRNRQLEMENKKSTLNQALQQIINRQAELEESMKKMDVNLAITDIPTYVSGIEERLIEIQTIQKSSLESQGKDKAKLENNEQTCRNLNKKIEILEKSATELSKWERLHSIFGSSDGKKFRNIAQSYVLRHLLIGANHYLRQLTDRYELECNPGSLTILILDKEAGGITRPTTTISGGEGFLISLALALGLSTLSKKALAMDILFVDEGFGTLDHTYLSTVIDTLERLHQIGGKKIGIISHVESLKERITTQIQVIKVNSTTSRVEITNGI